MKKLIISLAVLMLAACVPEHHNKVVPYEKNIVHEYHNDTDPLYYYVLYSYLFNPNGTFSVNHVYYYSNTTPIVGNDYSRVPFKTQQELGDQETHDIQQGIAISTETKAAVEVDTDKIPDNIESMEQAEVNQAYTEYEATQNEADSAAGTQESSAEPAESSSTSSDSSSSSSDSGGGDSGGGSSD